MNGTAGISSPFAEDEGRKDMARNGDGVFTRKDRPGFWISYRDAGGRRRRRKVQALDAQGESMPLPHRARTAVADTPTPVSRNCPAIPT